MDNERRGPVVGGKCRRLSGGDVKSPVSRMCKGIDRDGRWGFLARLPFRHHSAFATLVVLLICSTILTCHSVAVRRRLPDASSAWGSCNRFVIVGDDRTDVTR